MMRITKQADYGIVLMTVFADDEDHRVFTARDLAARARLPLPMVSKTLKLLAGRGLLESQRGPGGGYALTRDPEDVSVAEIIAALEGPIALTECSDVESSSCDQEGVCPTQANWLKINRVVHDALSRLTLADMARPLPDGRPGGSRGPLGKLDPLPGIGTESPSPGRSTDPVGVR
jgi:FeS assembly SUF system regulator